MSRTQGICRLRQRSQDG